MTGIKGTTINSLGYTGIVTLSQYIGAKRKILAKSHNEGGMALFNYLASCLAGDFDIVSVDRPTKILLLDMNRDESTGDIKLERAVNSRFITLLTKPEIVYSNVEGIVRYSFVIPQEMLMGTNFNAIGLYSASAVEEDINDYAACCSIELDKNNMSLSTVLVVDWELHISNKEVDY